jgi:hypothetical protein
MAITCMAVEKLDKPFERMTLQLALNVHLQNFSISSGANGQELGI